MGSLKISKYINYSHIFWVLKLHLLELLPLKLAKFLTV